MDITDDIWGNSYPANTEYAELVEECIEHE
jgi:hypothetical protein